MSNLSNLFRPRVISFFLILLFWTILLLVPMPRKQAEVVLGGGMGIFYFAKTLHVVVYASLTCWGGTLVRSRVWLISVLAILSTHALVSEFLQTFTNDRTGKWQDVLIDHGGIFLGFCLGWKWYRQVFAPLISASESVESDKRQTDVENGSDDTKELKRLTAEEPTHKTLTSSDHGSDSP